MSLQGFAAGQTGNTVIQGSETESWLSLRMLEEEQKQGTAIFIKRKRTAMTSENSQTFIQRKRKAMVARGILLSNNL